MIRRFALLQAFVAVARAGKMRQAALDLALTPGAVSQRIRQLEEVAGRRLFTRNPAGVELNPAGEALFAALAEPFRAIEAVDRELDAPASRRAIRILKLPWRRAPGRSICSVNRSIWPSGTGWENIPDLKQPGSLLPNLSSSQVPIFFKTALRSKSLPIAWRFLCSMTSTARTGRFGSKPMVLPHRTAGRARHFRRTT